MSLSKHRQDWEELARLDPLFAIFSDRARQYGKWDVEEFFLTGERDVEQRIVARANVLGYPLEWNRALDFGCGVGRLTRYLAKHFRETYGIDISDRMVEQASKLNNHLSNCKFITNVSADLRQFSSGQFDLVYSRSVLQHVPSRSLITSYISEFLRVLKAGGLLVFHLPCYLPLKHRLQPRRKLYRALRALGVSENFLYQRMRLNPIRMSFIPEREVVEHLHGLDAIVLDCERADNGVIRSCSYYITK